MMKSVTNSVLSVINSNTNDPKRSFGYTLNIKRAKANLLKSTKRVHNMDVEVKSGCVNMRFSGGAYQEVVLPLIRNWNLQVNEEFIFDQNTIKVIEVDEGVESKAMHVDTKLVVLVNGEKVVIHSYNSTQNVMIQGKNRETFVMNVLEPYFRQKIEASVDQINRFNKEVKDSLSEKSTIIYNCPHCEVKTATKVK